MNIQEIFADLHLKLQEAQVQAEQHVLDQYNKGFADGLAQTGSDKIYSQAEFDAALAAALAPVNEELAAVKTQLEALTAEVEVKVQQAVAQFKAELLAKYEEQQVVESATETGFKEFLT